MRRANVFALALSLLALPWLAACEGTTSNTLVIELVDAEGGNPAARSGGMLIYQVEQDGSSTTEAKPLTGPDYGFDAPIESVVLPTRLRIAFDLDDGLLVGSTPTFYPWGAGLVRVPVGALGECDAMLSPRLSTVRLDPAVIADRGPRWLVLGGATGESDGHDAVGVINPLWLTIEPGFSEDPTVTEVDRLTQPLGDTQAVALTGSRTLVVGDAEGVGVALVVESQANDYELIETTVTGVPNADRGATLVRLERGELGAAIVGGGSATERSDFITWVGTDGMVDATTRMATPRRRPAVAVLGNGGLLIAGGQAESAPELEFVPYRGSSVPVSAASGLVRERPAIVRAPASVTAAAGAALVIGGEDASGEPLDTTLLVTGCPAACTVTAGPTWERPRRAPTVLATAERTWLLGGSRSDGTASDAVDVVVFAGPDLATIQLQQDRTLENARARGTAIELDSGIIVLLGGERGPDDPLQTLEMCWPQALEGVDFP